MKNKLMDREEKGLLRKQAVIESVKDFLKHSCQVEHSRDRNLVNFLVNLLGALSAYSCLPHKPSIRGVYDKQKIEGDGHYTGTYRFDYRYLKKRNIDLVA